jgi:hypothetical protein
MTCDQYLVSLRGYEGTRPLRLFGSDAHEVAKRMVEISVRENGVPDPWIGYRIERFVNGSICEGMDYIADIELYETKPDWRKPGVSKWRWGGWFQIDEPLELGLEFPKTVLIEAEKDLTETIEIDMLFEKLIKMRVKGLVISDRYGDLVSLLFAPKQP